MMTQKSDPYTKVFSTVSEIIYRLYCINCYSSYVASFFVDNVFRGRITQLQIIIVQSDIQFSICHCWPLQFASHKESDASSKVATSELSSATERQPRVGSWSVCTVLRLLTSVLLLVSNSKHHGMFRWEKISCIQKFASLEYK